MVFPDSHQVLIMKQFFTPCYTFRNFSAYLKSYDDILRLTRLNTLKCHFINDSFIKTLMLMTTLLISTFQNLLEVISHEAHGIQSK